MYNLEDDYEGLSEELNKLAKQVEEVASKAMIAPKVYFASEDLGAYVKYLNVEVSIVDYVLIVKSLPLIDGQVPPLGIRNIHLEVDIRTNAPELIVDTLRLLAASGRTNCLHIVQHSN